MFGVQNIRAAIVALGVVVFASAPVHGETLQISGVYGARSDGAAALNTIAIERFGGADGARLGFALEDSLSNVVVENGERWFQIVPASLGSEADGLLSGYARPRFSEEHYDDTRRICWTKDDRGRCTEHREVETECIHVTVSLRPELRLRSYKGNLLWSSAVEPSRTESFCPEFDDSPDADPLIEAMIDEIAQDARMALAPIYRNRGIRIMESRRGLAGDDRGAFREAVRLTKTDERAACDEFARLLAITPNHASLLFNNGLCSEQMNEFDTAEAFYQQAQTISSSRGNARSGLSRISARLRAQRQMDAHNGV